ncbi:MAG: fused MFS/spermidine synthase [Chloroflexi bacterium]|nr:fused MFS/spermidine synthase [Chloroflexota bacterium]
MISAGIAPTAERERSVDLSARLLRLLVFLGGFTSLAIELAGSRLLAPYFGTSLYIWAVLVGLVLLYLTAGYFIGGRLGDRRPDARLLFQLTAWAGFMTGIIPIIARPILGFSAVGFANLDAGVFLGSLVGVVLLFAVPITLLGCVSPFAIRLALRDVSSAGNTSGRLYALSTCGSILGALIPVFVMVPLIGTPRTFYALSLALLGLSVVGLWRHRSWYFWLLLPVACLVVLPEGVLRPAPFGRLLYATESDYYYIQVAQQQTPSGAENDLILDEGHAIHSIYNPNQLLTGGPWDYFMVAPYFNSAYRPSDLHSAAIIGLAGGTIARDLTAVYGPVPIDGVEIDPKIIDVGRTYFGMTEPNLNAIAQDGRYFITTTAKRYDLVGIDAYRQPYIPFHLTTKQFFQEVRDHLTPRGVAVINAGRTETDYRLVDVIAGTMKAVFPNVFVIDLPNPQINSIVVGTNQPASLSNFAQNAAAFTDPTLRQVANTAMSQGRVREVTASATVFTDDWAPVEKVIDEIILGYARGGSGEIR